MQTKKTQVIQEDQMSNWQAYQDLAMAVVTMSNNELLTLSREAMSSVVAMAASDELARRRPQGR